ncbi:MAG: CBS domain-containing protein [Gammaproteobacteria bacterium]|nr:CBS domain-containing protein [Gammaproteobacteria bacterium]
MDNAFARLQTKIMAKHTHFVTTNDEYAPVKMDDPALSVMTDFQVKTPYSTTENTLIPSALQQMKLSKVKSLFIVDQDDAVIGHISARDIQSTKATTAAEYHDIKQSEVTTKMLMIKAPQLHTLYFSELSNARVGHIVRLLHELQVNYIFVIEEGSEKIRGLFSVSRISLQLGENVMGDLSSHSVAEMSHLI